MEPNFQVTPIPDTTKSLITPPPKISRHVLKWLIILALALFIASAGIFWFGGPSFRESGVQMSIDGPTQIGVGDEVTYKIKYSNSTKSKLSNLRFSFSYPDESVVLKDGEVSLYTKETFAIETLEAGQSGEKEFRAFLVGNRGDIKIAKLSLIYAAGNLRTEFQKDASLATTITSIPVSLTLSVPPNQISGQPITYILDYRNETNNSISDLRFVFDYPDGFTYQSATPAGSGDGQTWNVANLNKGQGSRISINGVLNGQQGETKKLSVTLQRRINGAYIDYEKTAGSTVISSPLLGVDVVVNDSKEYTAVTGDTLNYTVKYSNTSNYTLAGVALAVKLEGAMYDIGSLDSGSGYFDGGTNTIIWNSAAISDFSSLGPNKRGQATFKIKTKPGFPSGTAGAQNSFIKATARISTANVPREISDGEVFSTASLITKISSQPTFAQLMYYNDQAFSSSGPFPPQVGKETFFTVHWQLVNPGNQVTEARISGVLPAGVNWKNITSVGAGQAEITFNKNTSEVVWNIGSLPSGVGINGTNKYDGSFQISVTPQANQKGSGILLLKNVKFSGIDSFTRQSIIIPANDLTTDDTADQVEQGIVQ